ncbi:glycerol dehydrogenase [Micrococcus luteus]|uniref:glycerol dehydrogenase n=1 Tax=Micrococcus luteus TaxID=1270 RepID=UPI001C8DCBF6|nr:glycerol dehydrogenase [Micrococcus luteus]MBY0174528.1 glycerol dehydrogenase [Micrococcus luteus]MCV7455030.1 glycerol dehydrogenase [Micrococcus luteus]MCV7525867.1 glycerol dehydrogenase [Micrococcus luteus]MCV7620807.1 glycerol dehydrogenase [Micrococcus luteus]
MSTVVEHVLAAPSRYVQGRNVIQKLGSHLKPLGSTPLLVADDVVWEIVEDSLTKGFEEADLPVTRVGFGKFATAEAVDSLVETLRNGDHDVIVGIGGGSAIDAAKAAGHLAGISWASVPTAASSDAPTSALAVIYTDEGEFVEYRFFPKNPDLVLIDTVLVANAPERFLVGGIGDALATWVEARAVAKTRAQTMVGDAPTHTGTALAELSWKILWENALDALDAVRSRTVTPALEAVVEANTLLSGLGFESGGLAAAHAIHNGMTAAPQTHGLTHGEKVNIGTLTQLIMEGAPSAEIEDFIVFSTKVGLPNSLAEIGLAPEDRKEIRAIAEAATVEGETIHNMPFTVTPELVAEAMTVAETLSRRIRAEHGLPEPQLYQAEH